jgi:hypothetical protein
MKKDDVADPILKKVDADKRDFLRKLIGTTAFSAPIIASFSMKGLTIADAHAADSVAPPPP